MWFNGGMFGRHIGLPCNGNCVGFINIPFCIIRGKSLTESCLTSTAGDGEGICSLSVSFSTGCFSSEVVLLCFWAVFLTFFLILSTGAFVKDSSLGRFSTSIVGGASGFFGDLGDYGCGSRPTDSNMSSRCLYISDLIKSDKLP
jgi:hypothetical protein